LEARTAVDQVLSLFVPETAELVAQQLVLLRLVQAAAPATVWVVRCRFRLVVALGLALVP
jgi:hypothetical protein